MCFRNTLNIPDYTLLLEQTKNLKKYSKVIYYFLIPYLKESHYKYILGKKKNNRGPKLDKELIERFLQALFHALDNAPKVVSLEQIYGVSRGSYYRLLRILYQSHLLEQFHQHMLEGSGNPSLLLVDSSHIRSVDGSDGVNYGFKEHSKKALKVTVVTGINKVIYFKALHPDNYNDHLCFEELTKNHPSKVLTDVLADRAYVGKRFKTAITTVTE